MHALLRHGSWFELWVVGLTPCQEIQRVCCGVSPLLTFVQIVFDWQWWYIVVNCKIYQHALHTYWNRESFDCAWSRWLDFIVAMQFLLVLGFRKSEHNVLKFVRIQLIGARYCFRDRRQRCSWRLSQHPQATMIIGWLEIYPWSKGLGRADV